MYQIVSSSSEHSTPSPTSDKDSDYQISEEGREDAPSLDDDDDNNEEEMENSTKGAPGGWASTIPPSPDTSPELYIHPHIEPWEEDVDWDEYDHLELSPKMVEEW